MAKARSAAGRLARFFLGGCLFLGAGWAGAFGAPPVAKMLEYMPRQDVAYTTPGKDDQASCKVDLAKDKAGGSAWVLTDAAGKTLRRFASKNNRDVDTWSYYKDGVEVHRQSDTTGSGRPDQFRWLNAGGSRWGVDVNKDGKIDAWKVISPEEVSQEVLRAMATRDMHRLSALLITDEDLRTLGLPAADADAIRAKRKDIKAKFDATIAKLPKLSEKAAWVHLEVGPPQCIPAEQAGTRADLYRHSRATVLFESGGANEWFQVGPMVLVGAAWKIIDAPTPGAAPADERTDGSGPRPMDIGKNPRLQEAISKLTEEDKKPVPSSGAAAVKHHLNRADLLERIVALVEPTDREMWIRQVADSLSSAVQASGTSDTAAATRLTSLERQLVQAMPGNNLTAYVVFRRLQADYSRKLSGGKIDFEAVQKEWMDKLTAFVKAYPRADDAADAMLQLGMVCEFLAKDVEAKNWYGQVTRTFKDKPHAAKAEGAVRRLELEGRLMSLAGPLLQTPSTAYDLDQQRGKLVIVYYWASWNGQAAGDFARLKAIVDGNGGQVNLVSVNLDGSAEEARAFLAKHPVPGVHLHQPGGLESRLATQYGIQVLPSLFVVGRDGKCLNKAAQIGTLEQEIKKHVKR